MDATLAEAPPLVDPETDQNQLDAPIVFFDGVCGLCNAFVNFLLNANPDGPILFAPLQGETAARLLPETDRTALDTVVFLRPRPGETGVDSWRYSAAVVRILWRLGGFWKVAAALLWLIPLPLRNLGYGLFARWRYRLFGKHDTCRLPTPAERARFLP